MQTSHPIDSLPLKAIAAEEQPRLGLGIALMLVCVGFFAAMSVTVKFLAADYSTWQIVLFRNMVPLPIIFLIVVSMGGLAALRTRQPGKHLLRNGMSLVSHLLLFHGLGFLALADASAIQFMSPLMVTALSALILKEKVGPRRWFAVFAGFCVVVLMVAPSGNVQWASLMVLASTVLYGLMVITTRVLSRTDSAGVIFFYLSFIGTLASAAAMPFVWVTPPLEDLGLLFLVGVFGGLAQFTLVSAVRLVAPSILAPFEYTLIIWAVGFDVVLWHVNPAAATLIGATIIAMAGLYIAQRESQFATRLWAAMCARF